MEPVDSNQLAERGYPLGQGPEQVTQRICLNFQLGNAGTLARNAKKFDMHDASAPIQMITSKMSPKRDENSRNSTAF